MKKIEKALTNFKSKKIYNNFKKIIQLEGLSRFAPSSLTFYLVLSIVPIFSIVAMILSILGYNIHDILKMISDFFGIENEIIESLNNFLNSFSYSGRMLFSFGLLITIYISSKGISFFILIFQRIMHISPKFKSSIFERLWCLLLSLFFDIFFALFIIFLSFFNNIFKLNNTILSTIIKILILLILLFIFLLNLFVLSSQRKITIKNTIPGVLFSSICISCGITFYVYYLTNISHISSYYGPLTSYIFLFLIIYYSSYLVLIGIEINYLLLKKTT